MNQHRREREIGARLDKSTKDCRCRTSRHRRRRNASGTTIRRTRTCENPSRSAGPGRRGTTVTAGNPRMSSTPAFHNTAPVPGGVASGQTHHNVHNLVPLLPSSVRKFGLVRCPRNSGRATAAKTPPAHKPPASMSWSARRLRQEPFDERSAWKFPPDRTPHFFEIGEKCENPFSCKARGVI